MSEMIVIPSFEMVTRTLLAYSTRSTFRRLTRIIIYKLLIALAEECSHALLICRCLPLFASVFLKRVKNLQECDNRRPSAIDLKSQLFTLCPFHSS